MTNLQRSRPPRGKFKWPARLVVRATIFVPIVPIYDVLVLFWLISIVATQIPRSSERIIPPIFAPLRISTTSKEKVQWNSHGGTGGTIVKISELVVFGVGLVIIVLIIPSAVVLFDLIIPPQISVVYSVFWRLYT